MVSNTRDKDASPETIICLESAILLRVDMEEVKGFFTVKLIKTSIFHVVQGLQWLLATAERLESGINSWQGQALGYFQCSGQRTRGHRGLAYPRIEGKGGYD
ncbi:hypothetical protein U1Q18_025072 [Sarracenia purpurea var. burkii]